MDEVKGKSVPLKRDRREGRRGDADKNGGYLSLRTRKLEGAKEDDGKVRLARVFTVTVLVRLGRVFSATVLVRLARVFSVTVLVRLARVCIVTVI